MSEHVYLVGSEDVVRAASAMSQAAREMQAAAGAIEAALQTHRQWLDEWLGRFESALERARPGSAHKGER